MSEELSETERAILEMLRYGAKTAIQVAMDLGVNPSLASTTLKGLRRKGWVVSDIGASAGYRLARPLEKRPEEPGKEVSLASEREAAGPLKRPEFPPVSPPGSPPPETPREEPLPPEPPREAPPPPPRRESRPSVIPPPPDLSEPLPGSEPLRTGGSFLVEEPRPDGALTLARRALESGRGVLCLTRLPPEQVEQRYSIPRQRCRWIGQEENGLWRLDAVHREARLFLEKEPKGLVVLEGLDLFATLYPFVKLAQFVRDMRGLASKSRGTLLVTVNSQALGEKETAVLTGEMETIQP
ncbi:MAG: DUF835 domain-containing protein [Euryarchaeota archaeon]|nr:DUF835 domain-containing protein [Euryarchaeota archaeon]